MQLRLRNLRDVRVFALSITAIAMVGTLGLLYLLLPSEVAKLIQVKGCMIAVILSAPISYFVGLKLHDVTALTKKLEYAVNHDGLTGAYTRVRLHEIAAQLEVEEMVLVAADIDWFKKVNDTHGHQAGDVVLKRFVDTLRQNCREGDIVARFGGEEFILLLPGLNLVDGVHVVQRLCDDIRKKRIHIGEQELGITASFGVVALHEVTDLNDALKKADRAVYRAKREGRDRVCVFDPEIDVDPPETSEAA